MNKKIDYFSIIKEAINITKKNRVLWWFGLLAVFGGMGCSFNGNFSGNSSGNGGNDEIDYEGMFRKLSFYWENYAQWIILAVVMLVILGIAFYLVGLIGRGALVDSIFKVLKNENVTFSSGFKRGATFLKKIFVMNIIFTFSFLLFLFILAFPIVRLVILESYGIAIFLGIIAFMLVISISILFFYLVKYAQIYLISSGLGVIQSIKLAYRLFERNMKESFIMGLVMIAVGFVSGMIIFLGLMAVLVPAGLLSVILYKLTEKIILIVVLVIAGLIIVGLSFLVSAILNVFSQSAWVLFFNQIAKSEEVHYETVEEDLAVKINENGEVKPNIS